MHVSFSLNGTPHVVNRGPSSFASDIIDFFLNSVGATLTEIKGVELRCAILKMFSFLKVIQNTIYKFKNNFTTEYD